MLTFRMSLSDRQNTYRAVQKCRPALRQLLFSNNNFPVPVQTNGNSNGLVPMLRVYNNTARYVDQGGNKVLA